MKAAFATLLAAAAFAYAAASPFWDYVNKPDPAYAWRDTGFRYHEKGWTGYMLNLTSQTWLSPADSNRYIWTHQLLVVVPDNLKDKNHATIYATGGSNHGGGPPSVNEDVLAAALTAVSTGTIGATVWQIPNQPIVFASDPQHKERSEDHAVGWTWIQYLATDNPDWIIYFPMAKSVIKAMDAVTEFTAKTNGTNLENWVVYGASKRGWTTWFTGALNDPRIMGIAPIVMDMLNFTHFVPHMFQAYGGWTFAFEPYWELNITELIGTPKMDQLASVIDPLVYKDNLTLPKLIIDSTGDEFFMPDDDYYWWGDLPGETYRLMIQNAEHTMATGVLELLPGLWGFYTSLMKKTARPVFDWSMADGSGEITITVQAQPMLPTKVTMYSSHTLNDTRRDFRLVQGDTPLNPCHWIPVPVFGKSCLVPQLWSPTEMKPVSQTTNAQGEVDTVTYKLTQPMPEAGFTGFLGELEFPAPDNQTFIMTTQVSIIPQRLPFPPCGTGASCIGGLL